MKSDSHQFPAEKVSSTKKHTQKTGKVLFLKAARARIIEQSEKILASAKEKHLQSPRHFWSLFIEIN